MKRTVMVLLMVASAAALFANGNSEPPNAGDMTGPEYARVRDGIDGESVPRFDGEFTPVELTGTVSMMDDHAVLTADGKTYLLAIPRIAWYADEVADGTLITVSGNLVEDADHDEVVFDGDGHIAVSQVEIDGEVITLGPAGGPGARGDIASRGNFRGNDRYGRTSPESDRSGRGGYGSDDTGRRMPERETNEYGREQMPRGDADGIGRRMPRGRRI